MRKKIVPALLAVFLGAASFVCFAHLYAEDATLQDSKPKDAAQKDTIQKDATSKSDPPGAEGQSDRQNDDI